MRRNDKLPHQPPSTGFIFVSPILYPLSLYLHLLSIFGLQLHLYLLLAFSFRLSAVFVFAFGVKHFAFRCILYSPSALGCICICL
jgi:hypothetical protein